MTRKRDLQWQLKVFDNTTDELVGSIPLNNFDLRAARKIWSIHGHLDDEDYFLPDWWFLLNYLIEPAHLSFVQRFTDQQLDLNKYSYDLKICPSPDGDARRLKLPRAAWLHMKYQGRVGQKRARSDGWVVSLRWHLEDGRILEWDPDVLRADLYTPEGEHLGEFDPVNGALIGPPQPGSRVEP